MQNQEMTKENQIIIGAATVLSIIVIIFAVISVSVKGKDINSVLYDAFAQCLTDKGAVMYGAYWCPHCKDQKAAFGDSFRLINYVECTDNTKLCIDKGVQSFPTWLIGTSTKIEGFGSGTMKDLSEATGCPLPEKKSN